MTDNREEKEKEEAVWMRGMMVAVRCTVRRINSRGPAEALIKKLF